MADDLSRGRLESLADVQQLGEQCATDHDNTPTGHRLKRSRPVLFQRQAATGTLAPVLRLGS